MALRKAGVLQSAVALLLLLLLLLLALLLLLLLALALALALLAAGEERRKSTARLAAMSASLTLLTAQLPPGLV